MEEIVKTLVVSSWFPELKSSSQMGATLRLGRILDRLENDLITHSGIVSSLGRPSRIWWTTALNTRGISPTGGSRIDSASRNIEITRPLSSGFTYNIQNNAGFKKCFVKQLDFLLSYNLDNGSITKNSYHLCIFTVYELKEIFQVNL